MNPTLATHSAPGSVTKSSAARLVTKLRSLTNEEVRARVSERRRQSSAERMERQRESQNTKATAAAARLRSL